METHGGPKSNFPYIPINSSQVVVWVCLTIVFFGSAVWFPLVGIFLSLLTPIPSSLSVYQWGLPRGCYVPGVSLLVAIAVFSISGVAPVVSYLFTLLLMGILIGYFARSFASREFTVCASAAVAFMVGMLVFWFRHSETGTPLFQNIENKTFDYIVSLLKEAGVEGVDKPFIQEQLRTTVHTVVRLLPGAFLGSLLFAGTINSIGITRFSIRKGLPVPPWDKATRWRSPDWLVWPVICCGFALLISSSVRIIALNGLIVLGTIYFLQGLSILGFFSEKLSVPQWIRILGIVLILVQQYLSLFAAVLGFFDVWFDFRKITQERREI